jgi:hypothetical protein
MAVLSLGLVAYLIWLFFHEKSERHKRLQARKRNRGDHWGYV